jgi:hypothetical protein
VAEYSCVVPFLDNDPKFAYGVEIGMLYAEMRDAEPGAVIDGLRLRANQEQILLMANRLGWEVLELGGCVGKANRDWFSVKMRKPPGP